MALTLDQRKYYDNLDEMFATDGWKDLMKEVEREIYQLQADALESDSWDKVRFLQGRARQLVIFFNLEAESEAQKALLDEDDEA